METKMEKCYKFKNNVVHGKTMENLMNIIDAKLVNNKKDYLKETSKPSYISHKILDNDFVAVRKSKVTLTLNKPAYGNNSRLLFIDTDSLIMHEIKTENVYKDFSTYKKCLILVIIQLRQNIMMIQTS